MVTITITAEQLKNLETEMNCDSDVSNYQVTATCPECGRRWVVDREQAWIDDGTIWADDLCSEDDDRRAEN